MAYNKVYPTVNEDVLEYTKNQEDRIEDEFSLIDGEVAIKTTNLIYRRTVQNLPVTNGASLFYENTGNVVFGRNYIVTATFYNADYGVQETISYWVNRKFTSTLGMVLSPINTVADFELYISGSGNERISVRNKSNQIINADIELRLF